MNLVLNIPDDLLKQWEQRFLKHRVDVVSPGKRYPFSRDKKDNIFLEAAAAGKADFLITNDLDLLEISATNKRKLRFEIVTPEEFLEYWDSLS